MIVDYFISVTEIPYHITLVCFMSGCEGICNYCYNKILWDPNYKKDQIKSIDEIYNYISRSNKNYFLVDALSITGGEPLSKEKELFNFLKEINSREKFFINLDTSLTQGDVSRVLQFLDRISITIKEAWEFDKYKKQVEKNLEYVSKSKVPVEFRIVLTQDNVNDVFNVITNFRSELELCNIKDFRITNAITTQSNLDSFAVLSKENFSMHFDNFYKFIKENIKGSFDVFTLSL